MILATDLRGPITDDLLTTPLLGPDARSDFVVLRYQLIGIILGSIFLFIGLAACGTALIRSGGRVRLLLVWQGLFSAIYGGRIILQQDPTVLSLLARSFWPSRPDTIWIATYLLAVPAILFWLELTRSTVRRLLRITLVAVLLVAVAGICSTLVTDSPERFMPYNNILGIWLLLVLATVNAVPSLAKRFLVIQSRITAIALLVFAAAALYSNLQSFVHLTFHPSFEPLTYGLFILVLGYVAAERVFADERRLIAIDNELEIARKIQTSIIPSGSPELNNLRIAAVYDPMTAVAGDFYEFIPVDQHRVGIFVADVSGHGVPAALIAAMIKAVMQILGALCICSARGTVWAEPHPFRTTPRSVRHCGVFVYRYAESQSTLLGRGTPTTPSLPGRKLAAY